MPQKDLYLANDLRLGELEARLKKFTYLSKQALPGRADALIFEAIKLSRKIPSKEEYFYFYHWYIIMSQFARKEIISWKKQNYQHTIDPLIEECVIIIENSACSPIKAEEGKVDYILNIIIKDPVERNLNAIKSNLERVKLDGQHLKFQINKQSSEEKLNRPCEMRITFQITPSSCEKLKELIVKYPYVENIQIRRRMKQKKI